MAKVIRTSKMTQMHSNPEEDMSNFGLLLASHVTVSGQTADPQRHHSTILTSEDLVKHRTWDLPVKRPSKKQDKLIKQ